MGLNLSRLLDRKIHVCEFSGEDAGAVELDAVFCHGSYVRMIKSDMPMVPLQTSVDRMTCLSNLDRPGFAGNTVC
jgi:hypothetical protein